MAHEGQEEASKEAAGTRDLDNGESLLMTRPGHGIEVTPVRVAEAVQGAAVHSRSDHSVHGAYRGVVGEHEPVLVRPETAHPRAPSLDTGNVFEVLQGLKESIFHIFFVTDVSLVNFVGDLLPVVTRAPDIGRRGAEVESDDLAPGLQGEGGQRPDTLLVTALPGDRITLAVSDNSGGNQQIKVIFCVLSVLPGEYTDWKVLIVDEKHPSPCLVQLLQDVQEGGIGGVDIILDQRLLF